MENNLKFKIYTKSLVKALLKTGGVGILTLLVSLAFVYITINEIRDHTILAIGCFIIFTQIVIWSLDRFTDLFQVIHMMGRFYIFQNIINKNHVSSIDGVMEKMGRCKERDEELKCLKTLIDYGCIKGIDVNENGSIDFEDTV